jgi:signal transduction histidine kinase
MTRRCCDGNRKRVKCVDGMDRVQDLSMKQRAVSVLLLGFGTLVALIGVFGFSVLHRAGRIEAEVAGIHEVYRQSVLTLRMTKEEIYRSGITVRDYLLDPSPELEARYEEELAEIRHAQSDHVVSLYSLIGHDEEQVLERLGRELDYYWDSIDSVFSWTSREKIDQASAFLQEAVMPRRDTVISLMREIDAMSERIFEDEQEKIEASRKAFYAYLARMLGVSLLFAFVVAGVSVFYVSALDRRSERQRGRAEMAEEELRNLSNRLVQVQEEERKAISRELHDEIGQMLTGLKMALSNLEGMRDDPGNGFEQYLAETRALAERTMKSVRELAMGLRPSMLDDLGLEPALRWLGREFSRVSGVPVSLDVDGDLENLSDQVRTCIYRVVQESLTNCARHADAGEVRITVRKSGDHLFLSIKDDGSGFDLRASSGRGFGLVGMEERIRKLGGTLTIHSANRQGTTIDVEVPLVKEGRV